MKEFIDGMRYDTTRAVSVATHEEPSHTETLYLTKQGRWYIVYSWHTAPGAAINPIERDQAFSWMKDHQLMGALDEHFSDRIQDA